MIMMFTCSLHLLSAVPPWVSHEFSIVAQSSRVYKTLHLAILTFSDMSALVNVLRELRKVTHEWYDLGLLLGLEYSTLETIKASNQSLKECQRSMVIGWLQKKGKSEPSWQGLVKALRDALVDRPDIAKQIEQKYP